MFRRLTTAAAAVAAPSGSQRAGGSASTSGACRTAARRQRHRWRRGRRHDSHHHRRPLEPLLEGRGRHRQVRGREARLPDDGRRAQATTPTSRTSSSTAPSAKGQGHHPRPGRRGRERRRGARRPPTPASRCSWSTPRSPSRASPSPRSSPTTPRAPRSAREEWAKAVGEQGQVRRAVRQPDRQQRAGALRRLRRGAVAVPRPQAGPEGDRELGPRRGQGQDGDHAQRTPQHRRAWSRATTRWPWVPSRPSRTPTS